MLGHIRRLTIHFLSRPTGTALLVWVVSTILLTLQPQPWNTLERMLLAILPAVGPGLLAALLHPRSLSSTSVWKVKGQWLQSALALILWLILLVDIGPGFLSWILVFGIAEVAMFFSVPRFARALAAGMILFAAFYLTMRLHQAEQLGWLHLRVARESQAVKARARAEIDHDVIRFLFDGRELLNTKKPESLSPLEKTSEDSFPGLNPLILLSANPRDERAIPLVGLLSIPEGFPPKLWNIQLESTLAAFHREGRIGEARFSERKAKCGAFECQEYLWVYEDKFQGRNVQTGYALIGLAADPVSKGAGMIGLMVWFREPFAEGLPHSPAVLDFVKALRPATAGEGKAN